MVQINTVFILSPSFCCALRYFRHVVLGVFDVWEREVSKAADQVNGINVRPLILLNCPVCQNMASKPLVSWRICCK